MNNKINNIMYLIVFILTIIFIFTIPVQGASINQDTELINFTDSICSQYKKPCTLKLSKSNLIQGYLAYNGTIIITNGLRSKLSIDETKAVILHEIGHYSLNHYQKRDKFMEHWDFNLQALKEFKHKTEIEADIFATSYYLLHKQFNYLPSALSILTDTDKINLDTSTHPSTKKRIDAIKQFTDEYKLEVYYGK